MRCDGASGHSPSPFAVVPYVHVGPKRPQLPGARMERLANRRSTSRTVLAGALALGAVMAASQIAKADEGGVSFWIPGFFGSLAASPLVPGASFTTILYDIRVKAGADVAFARQVTRGNITANFTGNLNASLNADVALVVGIPSYTFAQPFLGGQASVAMLVPWSPRAKA